MPNNPLTNSIVDITAADLAAREVVESPTDFELHIAERAQEEAELAHNRRIWASQEADYRAWRNS